MTSKTIVSALGLLVSATLLVTDSAHARRSRGDHHGGAAYTGGFYYPYYPGRWGAAAAANVDYGAIGQRLLTRIRSPRAHHGSVFAGHCFGCRRR